MRGPAQLLEDFGAPSPHRGVTLDLPAEDVEAERLESFEKGYKAGWDDCLAAQSEDRKRISSGLERSLQDMSFTFHEARSAVLTSIGPLLDQLVTLVLPELACKTFAPRVIEEAMKIAEESASGGVEILTAPANRPALEEMAQGDHGVPVSIVTDDSLTDDQAIIRVGAREQQLDTGAVLDAIQSEITAFLSQTESMRAHG